MEMLMEAKNARVRYTEAFKVEAIRQVVELG